MAAEPSTKLIRKVKAPSGATTQEQMASKLQSAGMVFIENRGQVTDTEGRSRPDIAYTAGMGDMRMFFSGSRISYVFVRTEHMISPASDKETTFRRDEDHEKISTYRMDFDLHGANPSPRIRGEQEETGRINYYPAGQREGILGVRAFRTLVMENVYENIDLVYRAHEDGSVKYDFVVRPGGDASSIRLRYSGADNIRIGTDGELVIESPAGRLLEGTPVSYQAPASGVSGASPAPVQTDFKIEGDVVTFSIPAYDRSKTLVIDPSLQWSTYYGGFSSDYGYGIATGPSGEVLVTGYTISINFPVSFGAFQTSNQGGRDAFAVKFDASGIRQWATYFGGSNDDRGFGIAADGGGNVYFAGDTFSQNFPVTPGAFQTGNGGGFDAFLVKLDPSGIRLWASYAGSFEEDKAFAVDVDAAGNAVIAGKSRSVNFPVTNGTAQTTNAGGEDAFVLRFNTVGARLWGTYYGGREDEYALGVKYDGTGNVFITGPTLSPNFPTTGGAFQSLHKGSNDAFLVKLTPSGGLHWATLYGGAGNDVANGVTVDAAGNPTFAGVTTSPNFPTSNGAFRPFPAGGEDPFIVKFNAGGQRSWGTYSGGALNDGAFGISSDAIGNTTITGQTYSPNFPLTGSPLYSIKSGSSDAFIQKFDPSGAPVWATYFGGTGNERGYAINSSFSGNLHLTGTTESGDFPLLGAYQTGYGGSIDAFVTKICDIKPLVTPSRSTNLCPGDSVTLTAQAGYTSYSWSTGASTQSIKVADEDLYAVTVTDAQGCSGTSDSIRVRVSPPLIVDAGIPSVVCKGQAAVLQGNVAGGTAPFSYAWTPTNGLNNPTLRQPTFTADTTRRFYLQVTDAFGCQGVDSTDVFVILNPLADAGVDDTLCLGSSTQIGTPAVILTSYSWSPAAGLNNPNIAQPIATPEVTTNYVLTVTNMIFGCVSRDTVRLTVDQLQAHAGPDRRLCAGDTLQIGAPATGAIGAVTYSWAPSTGLTATNIAQPGAFPAVTTDYEVTTTDAFGCISLDTVTVDVSNALAAFAGPDRDICRGAATVLGDTAVCGVPPYSYHWSPPTWLSDTTVLHPTLTPQTAGPIVYTLTVTDAGLNTATSTVTINVNANPIVDAGPYTIICQGGAQIIGNTASGGTGPYTYQWTPSTGLNSATIAQPVASPAVTTHYTVIATDAEGCSGSDTVTVHVSSLTARAGGPVIQHCIFDTVTIGNFALGGVPYTVGNPYMYSWTPAGGLSATNVARPRAFPAVTTTYTVTVTDSVGCQDTDTVRIEVNPLPVAHAGRDTLICRYETAILGAPATAGTPPYTYAWTPTTGILGPPTTPIIFARPSDTTRYVVRVTDARGCVVRDTVKVDVRPHPTVFAGNNVTLCQGDSVAIGQFASGGTPPYIYSWAPRAGLYNYSGVNDSTIAQPWARPFATTTYTVTVTDAKGCQDFSSVTVRIVTAPLPKIRVIGSTVFCEGGSVTLDCDSALQYNGYIWYKDNVAFATTRQVTVTETGLYQALVNANAGCQASTPGVFVTVIPLPKPRITSAGPIPFCEGDTITLEADTTNFWTYLWSTGEQTRMITVSTAGLYSVTVTDPYGCVGTSAVFPVTTFTPPDASVNASGPLSFCNGDSVTLEAVSIVPSYVWNTGATTRKITVKQSGSYFVKLTDNLGCSSTSSVYVVTSNAIPNPVIIANGPLVFCEGLSVQLDAGPGYSSYLWSTGASTRRITVDQSGVYWVIAASSAGCSKQSPSVTVTVRPKPVVHITPIGSTEFCDGDSVTLDAGAGFASYRWSSGLRERYFVVRQSGNFSVTVTDSLGCSATSTSVAVTRYARPQPVITAATPLSFCPGDSVVLDAGAGYISYVWSTGARTRTITVKNTGSFYVAVENNNRCSGLSPTVDVTVNDAPTPTVTPEGPTTFCQGGNVVLDAGPGYASYLWSTGARTRRLTVTQAGIYNVRVTNASGCTGESPFVTVVVQPNPPIPAITRAGNTLTSTPATSYQWNRNGAKIPSAVNRSYIASLSGRYTVTVTNEFGCVSTSAPFDFNPVGVDEPESFISQFNLYPDPNRGVFTVRLELSNPSLIQITISNILGQKLIRFDEASTDRNFVKTIDIGHLPAGLYIVQAQAGKILLTRRIVKQ